MPDVRDLPIGATTVGANYEKFQINTSDAGRELIVEISETDDKVLTTEGVLAAYRQLTLSAGVPGYNAPVTGGPDAGTFAAFGTATGVRVKDDGGNLVTDDENEDEVKVVFVRLQTTGTPDYSDVVVDADTLELEQIAVFAPAK